jgi:RimJ/RimL family protein N-acetyltransferase
MRQVWLMAASSGDDGLNVVADWAFDVLAIERLTLLTDPSNQPCRRVAMRCGFTREGVMRAYQPFKNARPDMEAWSPLPTDRRPWHESTE